MNSSSRTSAILFIAVKYVAVAVCVLFASSVFRSPMGRVPLMACAHTVVGMLCAWCILLLSAMCCRKWEELGKKLARAFIACILVVPVTILMIEWNVVGYFQVLYSRRALAGLVSGVDRSDAPVAVNEFIGLVYVERIDVEGISHGLRIVFYEGDILSGSQGLVVDDSANGGEGFFLPSGWSVQWVDG